MKNKVPLEEIQARREILRQHVHRGISAPSQLKALLETHYQRYLDPVAIIKSDIRAIQREDARAMASGKRDVALGEYVGRLKELYFAAWRSWASLDGSAKVGALNTAREIARDLARAYGIDPEMLADALIVRGQMEVHKRETYDITHRIVNDAEGAELLRNLFKREAALGSLPDPSQE